MTTQSIIELNLSFLALIYIDYHLIIFHRPTCKMVDFTLIQHGPPSSQLPNWSSTMSNPWKKHNIIKLISCSWKLKMMFYWNITIFKGLNYNQIGNHSGSWTLWSSFSHQFFILQSTYFVILFAIEFAYYNILIYIK